LVSSTRSRRFSQSWRPRPSCWLHRRSPNLGGVTAALPDHRLVAHNAATASENKIHDDAVARRHGFAGGLVPGITVFGYLTAPVVELWGEAWLERGFLAARFRQPIYDGDDVTVEGSLSDDVIDVE